MGHLGQEFYRSSYRNCINTIEARDRNGARMVHADGPRQGKPLSKYVVNREEAGLRR